MSARPSPSKSTAWRRYVVGMNWVWPMAPAQEPVRRSGLVRPRSRIRRAATSSSVQVPTRGPPAQVRVASERTTGRTLRGSSSTLP